MVQLTGRTIHNSRSTASIANNGMDNGEYAEEKGGEYQLSNRTKSLDSNDSNRHTMVNDREEVHSLAQRSTTIPSNVTLSAERLKIKAPFVIRVSDLTVLDSVPVHILTKNSLSVNVACGAWGSVTEVCPHPGQYAHFMSLNWKVPVMEGSNFRIHVWSRVTIYLFESTITHLQANDCFLLFLKGCLYWSMRTLVEGVA